MTEGDLEDGEKPSNRYGVSLRILHPSIDPAEITAALRLEPTRTTKIGEPRMTPKGTPLEGIWTQSYWWKRICCGYEPPYTSERAIDDLLDELEPHKDFFKRIRAEGGRCELFIGITVEGHAAFCVSHTMARKLAALALDIGVDIGVVPTLP